MNFALIALPSRYQEGLIADATESLATADVVATGDCFHDDRGLLRTARRFRAASRGIVLEELHRTFLQAKVSEILGCVAYPTRASYLYYAPGDFVRPHHDVQQCQYTVIAPVGRPSTLTTYPSPLTGTPADIFSEFCRDPAANAVEIPIDANQAVLFAGNVVMHARKPRSIPTISATFCYGTA